MYFGNIATNKVFEMKKNIVSFGRERFSDIILDNIVCSTRMAMLYQIREPQRIIYILRNCSVSKSIQVIANSGGFNVGPNELIEIKFNDYLEFPGAIVFQFRDQLTSIEIPDEH